MLNFKWSLYYGFIVQMVDGICPRLLLTGGLSPHAVTTTMKMHPARRSHGGTMGQHMATLSLRPRVIPWAPARQDKEGIKVIGFS